MKDDSEGQTFPAMLEASKGKRRTTAGSASLSRIVLYMLATFVEFPKQQQDIFAPTLCVRCSYPPRLHFPTKGAWRRNFSYFLGTHSKRFGLTGRNKILAQNGSQSTDCYEYDVFLGRLFFAHLFNVAKSSCLGEKHQIFLMSEIAPKLPERKENAKAGNYPKKCKTSWVEQALHIFKENIRTPSRI